MPLELETKEGDVAQGWMRDELLHKIHTSRHKRKPPGYDREQLQRWFATTKFLSGKMNEGFVCLSDTISRMHPAQRLFQRLQNERHRRALRSQSAMSHAEQHQACTNILDKAPGTFEQVDMRRHASESCLILHHRHRAPTLSVVNSGSADDFWESDNITSTSTVLQLHNPPLTLGRRQGVASMPTIPTLNFSVYGTDEQLSSVLRRIAPLVAAPRDRPQQAFAATEPQSQAEGCRRLKASSRPKTDFSSAKELIVNSVANVPSVDHVDATEVCRRRRPTLRPYTEGSSSRHNVRSWNWTEEELSMLRIEPVHCQQQSLGNIMSEMKTFHKSRSATAVGNLKQAPRWHNHRPQTNGFHEQRNRAWSPQRRRVIRKRMHRSDTSRQLRL